MVRRWTWSRRSGFLGFVDEEEEEGEGERAVTMPESMW